MPEADAMPQEETAESAEKQDQHATSVVTFHYSGHAEDKQGQIWLIPCSENHDCSKECAKPPCSEHHDCLKCENCARIPCSKDCSKDCAKVSLLVILEQLCERAHKEAKLIVLFDGCRTDGQPVSDPIVQRGTLANRKYLLLFACGRSRQAQEYLNPDGSHSGLFTLAFLMSVQACDELQSLWSTTQTTLKRLGRRGVMQDLQFMGNLPCFASEPNVFQNYRFAGLTQELKEMQATVLRVSQDRDHFKTKYEVEKEKLRRFEEQIVRLTTEKEELQSQCQDLDFKLRSLEVGQSSQSAAHLKLVELLKIYKGKLSEVNQKLENTNAEMKKKASECKYIKEQLEEKEIEFQKVSKKCAELQKQVDNYQHDNLSQSTDLQCFQMDRDLQKEHISQLKSQLQEYRTEKLQHQSEISELKREYTAKSVAMREIQKQNSVLQFQLREIQKQKNHPEFQNITRGANVLAMLLTGTMLVIIVVCSQEVRQKMLDYIMEIQVQRQKQLAPENADLAIEGVIDSSDDEEIPGREAEDPHAVALRRQRRLRQQLEKKWSFPSIPGRRASPGAIDVECMRAIIQIYKLDDCITEEVEHLRDSMCESIRVSAFQHGLDFESPAFPLILRDVSCARCCVASHVDVTSHPTRGPGLWVCTKCDNCYDKDAMQARLVDLLHRIIQAWQAQEVVCKKRLGQRQRVDGSLQQFHW
ncbi:unnamed protein product [Durusdinium trenchii]|uniref:DNA polymerase epsilon catalytic subunit n=1 Tax=Durusdinium trenchii TaxID=1381693 RepID=A0ABP0RUA6_9DINO